MIRRVAVRGIIVHDGKLLCIKLKPYEGAIPGDYWCTLGGTLDSGESLLPALEREIVEETNIKPKVGNLLYIQQFADNGKEHLEFFFHVLNPEAYENIDLSKTSHGDIEIDQIEFIDPKKYHVLPKFLTEVDLTKITDKSPVKIFSYL